MSLPPLGEQWFPVEHGDHRRCLKCLEMILPGQDRKPWHRRGAEFRNDSWGFRHKVCDGAALRAAREKAAADNAKRQRERAARRAPYTAGRTVTITDRNGKHRRVAPYARGEISRIVNQSRLSTDEP